ncbi:TetR/AcrR family transcriptional regulator [Rhizohabitans arisaemae]|uniref:TetR/AcrR family transcriptional regulator n=1 Tax=Rhizohabitans arisaemae TaxID=2720610 RepID=UPI0024B15749|nr:TetR/AcrR family transcriptional regulator [Rhizohabitans arisaemae]
MPVRQRRSEETVERLLNGALKAYGETGHDGFTLTAVVKTSGVSVGSLYHHFGSFDGLAAALYNRCMGELLDGLVETLEGVSGARAGVDALVRGYLRFTREHRAAAHFIHASAYASFLPAHAAMLAAAKRPRIARMQAWLRPYIDSGEVADLPDILLESLLLGPVTEVARRWLGGVPGIDLDEAARLLPEPVWRSVAGNAVASAPTPGEDYPGDH